MNIELLEVFCAIDTSSANQHIYVFSQDRQVCIEHRLVVSKLLKNIVNKIVLYSFRGKGELEFAL